MARFGDEHLLDSPSPSNEENLVPGFPDLERLGYGNPGEEVAPCAPTGNDDPHAILAFDEMLRRMPTPIALTRRDVPP